MSKRKNSVVNNGRDKTNIRHLMHAISIGLFVLMPAQASWANAPAQSAQLPDAPAIDVSQHLALLPVTLAPMSKLSLPPIDSDESPSAPVDVYGDALKRLNQRIKTRPTAQDLLDRGRVFALKSDFTAAIKDLTRAIVLKKTFDEAYKLRGYCYACQDKYRQAEADYTIAVQLKPKDVPVWIALGACYDKDKQPDKAVDAFNHAIALEPKESAYYAFKADVYGRAEHFEKASVAIAQGLKTDPKSRSCLYERAYLKELRKDKDGALKEFDKLVAEFPDFIQARKERASIYEEKGNYQKALDDYDALIDLVNTTTSKIVDGAVQKAEKTDILGGAMEMTAALAYYPEKIYFLRRRSEVYRLLRRFEDAMKDADYAISLAPTSALSYMQRGYVEFSMEKVDDAIKDFNKVLEIDHLEDTANWGRGFAYCLKGSYKQAAADFDRYSLTPHADPYVKYCYVYRALMLRLSGDQKELPALFAKAQEKLNHKEWPYPFLEFMNGKLNGAELEATADNNDKQTELHCFLALNAMAEKNSGKARDEFRWVLDKGNKDFFEYTLSTALIKKVTDESVQEAGSTPTIKQ